MEIYSLTIMWYLSQLFVESTILVIAKKQKNILLASVLAICITIASIFGTFAVQTLKNFEWIDYTFAELMLLTIFGLFGLSSVGAFYLYVAFKILGREKTILLYGIQAGIGLAMLFGGILVLVFIPPIRANIPTIQYWQFIFLQIQNLF